MYNLTVCEMTIAKLISKGYSNEEIRECLFIENTTLRTHISNIYQKMNIKSAKDGSMRVNIVLKFLNLNKLTDELEKLQNLKGVVIYLKRILETEWDKN